MAEYLILAVEPNIAVPDQTGDAEADDIAQAAYDARVRKGDIVVIRPDGWQWGSSECLPTFHVVKVAGQEVNAIYESPLWNGEKLALSRRYALNTQAAWGDIVNMTESEFVAVLIAKSA